MAVLGTFGQATAKQLRELEFADVTSHTPCVRTLDRLMSFKLIRRIEHRLVGGDRGGSGAFVYVLTLPGRRMLGVDQQDSNTVNYHTLQIVDTFVELHRLHTAGRLIITDYDCEPRLNIGGIDLRPDLSIELSDRSGAYMPLWLEVDMWLMTRRSEGKKQIMAKLERYGQAFRACDRWPVHRVIWLAQEQRRADDLRTWVNQLPEWHRELFRVFVLPEFIAALVPRSDVQSTTD